MHSFEVHSNKSACRKSGRLGLKQVYHGKKYLQLRAKGIIYFSISKRDISVCSFDLHKPGQYENLIT